MDEHDTLALGSVPVAEADFEAFYRREYRSVCALVFGLCGSRAAAEELTQDAFVKAHRRWATVGALELPQYWVRKVALNQARTAWRRQQGELRAWLRTSRPTIAELPPPADEFWATVRSLTKQQAIVVALHYADDCSVEQIALVIGCSESTVKTHLVRARQTLRQRLS